MSPRGAQLLKRVQHSVNPNNVKMPFYAVARGREVGVFKTWDTCQAQIDNYRGAKYKKFENQEDAWNFVKQFRLKSAKPFAEEGNGAPQAKQIKIVVEENVMEGADKVSNSTFDFAAFNVRLTNLENSYQEKIRSLEERLRALENDRAGTDNAENASQSKEIRAGTDNAVNTSQSEEIGGSSDCTSAARKMTSAKRKLLESAGAIIKPESTRSYSTSAQKKLKCEDEGSQANSSGSSVPFRTDSDGYVVVYTDGACSKNGAGPACAKAGIGVWFNDGHPLNVSAPVRGRATNNVAELQAATAAAEMAAGSGINKLCIMTDSQFTINCMTSWISKWKKNNWKTFKGEPVINKEEVIELEKACNALDDIKWVYVKGHGGIHGNEQADQLARNGAEMYQIP
ncbi:hypothetical protein ONE63_004975 [Megalurothrips usitatus]|uniref:ribonuclease H n=1 Tax=Megalurothrips usitatus TaxID=439358 RepID=A0AAV7X1E5_9NEOP|nr:hypothetical protein ONE63_004975 [Megalurothrips usitatus]